MFPSTTSCNSPCQMPRDSMFLTQSVDRIPVVSRTWSGFIPNRESGTNIFDLINSKFRHWIAFAVQCAAALYHVTVIIGYSSRAQVGRIYAWWIVATVKD